MINVPQRGPTTPGMRRHTPGLGSSPFARHYWGNHCYFLLLQVLRCFSSLRSPPGSCRDDRRRRPGCPIRKSAGQGIFAPYRGLSQLITSFIASVSQGIRHAPLLTLYRRHLPQRRYFTSPPQSVITLILSAVFFRSKKSGNCILYLAIEYFSVFPQPEGFWPSDCSLQSSLCQNVKDLVAADSCPSRSGE